MLRFRFRNAFESSGYRFNDLMNCAEMRHLQSKVASYGNYAPELSLKIKTVHILSVIIIKSREVELEGWSLWACLPPQRIALLCANVGSFFLSGTSRERRDPACYGQAQEQLQAVESGLAHLPVRRVARGLLQVCPGVRLTHCFGILSFNLKLCPFKNIEVPIGHHL